jgi:DHA1 family bicyclomycin/chloramphenicol resistance-like MFS transporter
MTFRRLLPIYLGAMLSPMGGVGVLTLLPVMARDWGVSIPWATLGVTVYMVPFVVFQLFSGPIAVIFKTRKTLLFGFGVYALGGFLSAWSPGIEFFLGFRFIQGFGAAFIAPIIMALIGEMVDPQKIGRSMGILGVMYTCGVTLGPLISGFLEVRFGWPGFFLFLTAITLAIGVLYGVTNPRSVDPGMGWGRIMDALLLVKKSYAYADVRFLSFSAFFLFIAFIGLMTFMAEHLKASYALPSDQIGLILSATGFSGILVSPIAGILGDRWGRKKVAYWGGTFMMSALVGLSLLDYGYERYLLLFSLYGAGGALCWTSLNTLAVQMIPDLRKPVASAYNCVKFSGYALAPIILGAFYGAFSIAGVRWACFSVILISLFLTSRIRNALG